MASATTSTPNMVTPMRSTDRLHSHGIDSRSNHFSHPTHHGRQDVLAIKQQLADALGENGPLYWDALRDFVMGKLNRQEFDFYANLYLSRKHAHLHNAFILSTIHNAQTNTYPPSKHRVVGWAKRKRARDGSLTDADHDMDPRKKKLKMDIMSLSKVDRERLKTLLKSSDQNKLQPLIDKLLEPRVSKQPTLPFAPDQFPPQNYMNDYSRGLLAPLCIDLKELPSPSILHSRMTSIALEHGLAGGVEQDAVNAMLFAMESYIKSAISNTISKRRVNRCIGVQMITASDQQESQKDIASATGSQTRATTSQLAPMNSSTDDDQSTSDNTNVVTESLNLHDLAFSFQVTPFVLVENPLNVEKLTALMTDSEDEVTDDGLGDTTSEDEFDL
ncbi:transcriptional regulator of RNA polII, SAGA, subunit-domain-containing protein [Radiomyces spectabilis]|uniref:transcriptional regulator of RNA polII, SAGA, subunit-domain-containing protein n=1 Tax=Radiomyces spectabilis TaxID=64574 RepID=UPI00221E8793|nr:transcriptional regulator of RNA polII, SAGA, subunit-domain-containing protein [Radiomyces spectabilis]KAI8377697.1 transcriptional regulator of RNA polII, SAGA, subunit-domain-containing protein [Radiomyces spectabilis]